LSDDRGSPGAAGGLPLAGSAEAGTLARLAVAVQAVRAAAATTLRWFTAADLAVMLSITSSLRGKALPRGFLAFGEVGLAGEVRPAPRGQERLKEAAKLGFSVAVVPKANAPKKPIEGLTVHGVERIEEAMELARGL
jgi:predicted ATPase with chaperone activity